MRQYQNTPRAEIHALIAEIVDAVNARRSLVDKNTAELIPVDAEYARVKKMIPPGNPITKAGRAKKEALYADAISIAGKKAKLIALSGQALQEISGLMDMRLDLEYEIHLRDTPELVARFGPGID